MLFHFAAPHALSALLVAGNAGIESSEGSDIHLITVFAGIAAISLLILVLIVIGILGALVVVGLKAKAAASKTATEVKSKVYPIIDKANGLVATLSPTIQDITEKTNALLGDLSPKISGITGSVHGIVGNVEDMSALAKQKLEEFAPTLSAINQTVGSANETVQDANHKTHHQVERVNGMITSVLDKVTEFPGTLRRAVQSPVKGAETWLATAKDRAAGLISKMRPRPSAR